MHYEIGPFKHIAGDLVQVGQTTYQIVSKNAFIEMRNLVEGDIVKIGYDPDEQTENNHTKAFFITSTTGRKNKLQITPAHLTRTDLLWHAALICAAHATPSTPEKLLATALAYYHTINIDPNDHVPIAAYM